MQETLAQALSRYLINKGIHVGCDDRDRVILCAIPTIMAKLREIAEINDSEIIDLVEEWNGYMSTASDALDDARSCEERYTEILDDDMADITEHPSASFCESAHNIDLN